MRSPKLFNYLYCLSIKERRELEKFLRSEYFNTNPNVLRLYEYLKSKKFRIEHNDSIDLEIFNLIFSNRKYNRQKIYDLYSETTRLLEKFLMIHKFQKDPLLRKQKLLEALNERNLKSEFNSLIRRLSKEILKYPDNCDENLFFKFAFYFTDFSFRVANNLPDTDYSLYKSRIYLDYFYVLTKLKLLYDLNQRGDIQSDILGEDFKALEGIISGSKEYPEIILIYYNLYTLTFLEHSTAVFERTIKLVEENKNQLDHKTLFDIYTKLQNYCIFKINEGSVSYKRILFNLYKKAMNLDVSYIDPMIFSNIVTAALDLSKINWALDFIENFKHKIIPEFRTDVYLFNKAKIYFHVKKYDEALEMLNKIKYKDIFSSLYSRALVCMIFYELNETERFYYSLDAFRHYLKRNRLIPDHIREMGYNFIKFSNTLYRIREGKELPAKLKENIKKSTVANKLWLVKKADELNDGKF